MPTGTQAAASQRRARRRLSLPALLGVLVVFLFLPQFVSLFIFGAPAFEPENGAVRAEVAGELVPDLGSALIAIAVIAWLGWGRLVWSEPRRTRRWVWVIPIALLVASIAGIGYGHLADVGPTLALTLLTATFFTGLSEELMFRGIALQAMRDRWREWPAAAGSSLLFGATHLVNAIVLGTGAIPQAIIATGAGYLLYLTRRVSGGIALPIIVHMLIDFSLFSHTIGAETAEITDAAFALLLVEIVLILVALIGVRAVDPRKPAPAQA